MRYQWQTLDNHSLGGVWLRFLAAGAGGCGPVLSPRQQLLQSLIVVEVSQVTNGSDIGLAITCRVTCPAALHTGGHVSQSEEIILVSQ